MTRKDMQALVRDLDGKARRGAFDAKTGINTWVLVRRMFTEAAGATKEVALVCREDDDPTKNVEGPDHGTAKAKGRRSRPDASPSTAN